MTDEDVLTDHDRLESLEALRFRMSEKYETANGLKRHGLQTSICVYGPRGTVEGSVVIHLRAAGGNIKPLQKSFSGTTFREALDDLILWQRTEPMKVSCLNGGEHEWGTWHTGPASGAKLLGCYHCRVCMEFKPAHFYLLLPREQLSMLERMESGTP